jgi:hypothetical protein
MPVPRMQRLADIWSEIYLDAPIRTNNQRLEVSSCLSSVEYMLLARVRQISGNSLPVLEVNVLIDK